MKLLPLPSSLKAAHCAVLLACLAFLVVAVCVVSGAEPVLLSIKRAVRLNFPSRAGESYQFYRSADLTTWQKYGGIVVGTGAEIALTHVTEGDAQSIFRVETLVEVIADLPDFVGYPSWKLVATDLGPNPALGGFHGENQYFRLTYVSPAEARLVNGQLPIGTIVVKEMRENNSGTPGAIAGPLTVMVKRGGTFDPTGNNWEYFMADAALSQTQMRGGSGTLCFPCHNAAKDTDFLFSATKLSP